MNGQGSDALQNEVSVLRKELQDEKNRHLRILADFDNYRKRVERDMESCSTRGKKELIEELIVMVSKRPVMFE